MHSVLFVAALTVVLSGDLNRMNSDQCLLWQFSELLRPTHNNVEVAAFVVRDDAGTLSCLLWPRLSWGRSQRFRGTIPQRTVAIVHTHPNWEPLPSKIDIRTAQRSHLPVYVVTRTEITKTLGGSPQIVLNGAVARTAKAAMGPDTITVGSDQRTRR